MNPAWIAAAGGVLSWPVDPMSRRVRRLASAQRLALVPADGRAHRAVRRWLARRSGGSTAVRSLPSVGLRALSAVLSQVLSNRRAGRAIALASAIAAGAAAVSLGAVTAVSCASAAAVSTGVASILLRRAFARRRRRRGDASLAQALAIVVAELQAGTDQQSLLTACGAVGTQLAELVSLDGAPPPVFEAARKGSSGDVDAVDRTVVAWRMSSSTGVALADVLARTRGDLAAAAATRREVDVAVAGPRSSAVLLASLPILGVGLGTAMGADPVSVLSHTQPGRVLLCLGIVLDALGLLWTDTLVARAQR